VQGLRGTLSEEGVMKNSWFRLLMAALLAALLGTVVAADEKDKEKLLFEDKFGEKLADSWSWVREDPRAWKLEKGSLLIRTSTGGLWMKDNNCQNILLCTPPEVKEGGFAVEVLVENEPSNAFEHAGLTLYYDDDHYASLLKEKVGNKQLVQLVSETQGKPKVGFAEKAYEGKSVWLRMVVSGGKVRGLFRATDKDDWQLLGQCDLPGEGAARIGLLTGYAAKNAEHWSRFSSFRLLQTEK
jgi:regulation of enolase protein 1 (concanavalin A-like superfamily)